MRIDKIMTDSNGYKLISASVVINNKKAKPSVGSIILFDYKDGILRQFSMNGYTEHNMRSFKRALYNILNDNHFNFYKQLQSTGFAD